MLFYTLLLASLSTVLRGELSLMPDLVTTSVGEVVTFTCTTTADMELWPLLTFSTTPPVDVNRSMIELLQGGARRQNLTLTATTEHRNLTITCFVKNSNRTVIFEHKVAQLMVQGELTRINTVQLVYI